MIVAQTEKPTGQGTINAIDAGKPQAQHHAWPVAALKWPGMTMDFGVAPAVDISALKTGIEDYLHTERGADGMYLIEDIKQAD